MAEQPTLIKGRIKLADFAPDDCAGLEKEPTKEKTQALAAEIGELQELLFANSTHAIVLLFQGIDASGKDGAVRHVLEAVNPAGVETANFKAPTEIESAHDFLWRVHQRVPRYGHIGIFNRSHYEAVLAERVIFKLSTKTLAMRNRQIVDFERMLGESRVVLLKFYLHLGKKEQAERFRARLETPHKKWKFSTGDLEVRRRWDEYQVAYEDMLNATSHTSAPWHLVPADRKWYRDFVVATATRNALRELKMKWPKPREDLSKIKIR